MNTSKKLWQLFSTFLILLMGLNLVAANAQAQLIVPDNKLVDAWSNKKGVADAIQGPNSFGTLPMSPERMKTFNFERAARWSVGQLEFAIQSYELIMAHGLDPKSSPLMTSLGAVALAVGYNYEVEPSFQDGLYTRLDRYFVAPGFHLQHSWKHLADEKMVARLGPSYKVEFDFYRQFQNPKDALLSLPYFERNLPFNSERTLNGLKEGDVFTFKANLDILTDLTHLTHLGISLANTMGPYFLVTGGFQVHVLRLPNNKVRLKLVSLRRQGGGFKANLGGDDLKVFGVSLVDDQIFRLLGADLLSLDINKGLNRAFIADYVLDLNQKDVAAAFDKAMAQARNYNYLQIVDPRVSPKEIQKSLVTNISVLDDLMKQDQDHGISGRVVRLEQGNNTSHDTQWHLKLGNQLIHLSSNHNKSQNQIEDLSSSGQKNTYQLKTEKRHSEFGFFFSLLQQTHTEQTSILEDTTGNQDQLIGYVMSTEKTDKRLRVSELKQIKKQIRQLVPQFADQIDFTKWPQDKTISNVKMFIQVLFTKAALTQLPMMNRDQFFQLYSEHLKKIQAENLIPRDRQEQGNPLLPIASKLEKITDLKTSLSEKENLLSELGHSSLFRKTGPGFLMTLLAQDQINDLVRVDFNMNSTEGLALQFSQGPDGPQSLFAKLLLTEHLTNEDGLDLRLEAQSLH